MASLKPPYLHTIRLERDWSVAKHYSGQAARIKMIWLIFLIVLSFKQHKLFLFLFIYFLFLTHWSWFSRLPHLYLWLSPHNFQHLTHTLSADIWSACRVTDPLSNTQRIISCCHQTGVPCCTYSEIHKHTSTRSLAHLHNYSQHANQQRELREEEQRLTETEREGGVGQGGGLETGQANHAYNCILTLGATGTRPLKIRLSWKHLSD